MGDDDDEQGTFASGFIGPISIFGSIFVEFYVNSIRIVRLIMRAASSHVNGVTYPRKFNVHLTSHIQICT